MLAWMKPIAGGLKKVFLVHGEPEQQKAFVAGDPRTLWLGRGGSASAGKSFDL